MDITHEFEPQAPAASGIGTNEQPNRRESTFANDDILELNVEEDALDLETADEVIDLTPKPALKASYNKQKFRALMAWTKLQNGRDLPSIEDASPHNSTFFTPLGIVFDLTLGQNSPGISYLGDELAIMCGLDPAGPLPESWRVSELLSRLHDKCNDTIASHAPTDFEVSWLESSGRLRSARGIILPFSDDDARIDQVLAIILTAPMDTNEMPDFRDRKPKSEKDILLLDHELDPPDAPKPAVQPAGTPFFLVSLPDGDRTPIRPYKAPDRQLRPVRTTAELVPIAKAAGALAQHLTQARDLAETAKASEDRSHGALYDAISSAYDFAIAAAQAPNELVRLLHATNITMQHRAPMTPIVKLVFSTNYDKTRLAEYAAALSHAYRIGLGRGALGPFLRSTEGGLKSVVHLERKLRRAENGRSLKKRTAPHPSLAKTLRAMPTRPLADLSGDGDEFTLVFARRLPDGKAVMVGEVPCDVALLERAARKLVADHESRIVPPPSKPD